MAGSVLVPAFYAVPRAIAGGSEADGGMFGDVGGFLDSCQDRLP